MIGRNKEKELLHKIENDDRSHFVAIYGRRRIGKTYLIRNYFNDRICFSHTGIANASLSEQLFAFHTKVTTYTELPLEKPKNWLEAFDNLKTVIVNSSQKRKIIFIDELPWLDTPRSNFLGALEYFWNSWASHQKNIVFIICGSATSYIVNKIFNNKGGLHNRVTQKIKIFPFTLKETKEFLISKGIDWTNYQITKAYMATGGIPFYLEAFKKGKSVEQIIDELFFDKNGLLYNEFYHLYASLFRNEKVYIEVIKALASKKKGLTRDEISLKSKISNGGTLTTILEELELSDFIKKYAPYGKQSRNSLYQLTDFFSLFYFEFINGYPVKEGDWLHTIDQPKHRTWSGYAFEQVCMSHVPEIKNALGISGVQTNESSWKSSSNMDKGAQIDLVMERRDRIIHLFEMKFSINEFEITKKYDEELRNKIAVFKQETNTKSAVWTAMMTTFGLKKNSYSLSIQNSLTVEDLFK